MWWGCRHEAAPAFEEKLAVHKSPLLAEYLLYFTVHDSRNLPVPPIYDEVGFAFKLAGKYICSRLWKGYWPRFTIICGRETRSTTPTTKQDLSANPFAIYKCMVEQRRGYNAYVEHDEMAVILWAQSSFFEQNDRELTTRIQWSNDQREHWSKTSLGQLVGNRSQKRLKIWWSWTSCATIWTVFEVGSEHVERSAREQYSTVHRWLDYR